MPSTLERCGLIGNTAPPNGLLTRFQRIVRPTLPAFSVAPMTATLRGAKIASRGRSNRKTVVGRFGSIGIRLLCHSSDGSCDRMCDLRFSAQRPR